MKKISVWMMAVVALGLTTLAAQAEQTNYSIGKVGGSEFKIGLGPRAVAMGQAFVAMADDVNSTAWNPAGLAQIQGYNAGLMHDVYLQDTSLEYVSYAQNLFSGAGLGANVMFLNFGKMDKVTLDSNQLPQVVGDFTPTVLTGALGYGQWLMSGFALGGAVKFISQNIDSQSYSAVAVDVAALIKLDKNLKAGLSIQNLGSTLGDAPLPMNAKAGLAYVAPVQISQGDVWNLVLDANLPFGDVNYTSANVGTEYWFNNLIAVRAGYAVKDTGDLGGLTGLTAGLGVKLPLSKGIGVNVDYALVSFGDLGMTHQLQLTANFQ